MHYVELNDTKTVPLFGHFI